MIRRRLLALLGMTAGSTVVASNVGAKINVPAPEAKTDPTIDIPVGSIVAWADLPAKNLMPDWMLCDGRSLKAAEYNELFRVIGTTYGGEGVMNTFNLPDLRPRVFGHHAGSDGPWPGHSHRFIADDLPAHSHSVGPTHQHTMWDAWSEAVPVNVAGVKPDSYNGPYTTGRYIGNGEYEAVPAHNVPPQPTMVMQHIIKVR